MKLIAILTIFLYFSLGSISGTLGTTTESQLTTTLLKNYNKISRPAPSPSQAVNGSSILTVNVGISLHQIINVDEKKQIITTNVMLRFSWSDAALTWNASDYGNLNEVRIPVSYLWRPDVMIYNIADEGIFQSNHYRGSMNTIVYSNGQVLFVPPMILKTTCKMDVTMFPFDTQRCEIKLGSWTYSGNDVILKLMEGNVTEAFDITSYVPNGEWQLVRTTSKRGEKVYDCCPETYYDVTFTLYLKRQSMYYFFNLLVPCALIGFLAVLGFTLPPTSGEKLSLGVTVLFSLIVFLNMISASMPSNSDAVPLLGTYFNCVMFMIASSVVSTVVINLNLRSINSPKEIGAVCQKIFFSWLPRLLRMTQPRWELSFEQDKGMEMMMGHKMGDIINAGNKKSDSPIGEKDFMESTGHVSNMVLKKKWMFAAVVVDRLCFVVSIIFIIISTLVFLISSFM